MSVRVHATFIYRSLYYFQHPFHKEDGRLHLFSPSSPKNLEFLLEKIKLQLKIVVVLHNPNELFGNTTCNEIRLLGLTCSVILN